MIRYFKVIFLSTALMLSGTVLNAQTFSVSTIEGGAEYALPDGEEFTPLEGGEELPAGTVIRSYPESSVVLTSDSGSAVRINENSELVIGGEDKEDSPSESGKGASSPTSTAPIGVEDKKDSQSENSKGASSPISTAPASKTLLDLYRGRIAYIFNAFSNAPKDKHESYFRIRTTSGVAAAAGGSGFIDSEGNFGATSGRLAVLSEAGKILRVEAGEGIRVHEDGSLEHITKLTDLPFGNKSLEAVLQLGTYARKMKKLKAKEIDLVKDVAKKSGFSEDRIKEAIHREYASRLHGAALRELRGRHRKEMEKLAKQHHRKVIRKEHHEKVLEKALEKARSR